MSAKEKSTGKEASIRVENTTTLGKDEIDRMVREAEMNAEADKKRKEKVEKRNNLDSLRIQAEKQVTDSASAPQDLKDKVSKLADDAKAAIQTDADDTKIDDIQKELEAALRDLMQAAAAQPGADQGAGTQAPPKDDDVVDADFKPAG